MQSTLASAFGAGQMSIHASLRRTLPTWLHPPRRFWIIPVAAIFLLLHAVGESGGGGTEWRSAAPLPLARTEVAATVAGGEIVVAAGFLADGSSSKQVDAYSPARDRWRRLPDLPVAVNHAMAVTFRGRPYVIGGYAGPRRPLRAAYRLEGGRWQALPRPPAGRAAAGAAVAEGKLYVVGGIGPGGLARTALVFDFATSRWSTMTGPTPREHLATASIGGRVYALAGRLAGIDTNLALLEVYTPGQRGWRKLRPIPHPRGGTGVTVLGSDLVSVGGEEPSGTIASVYAYGTRSGDWRRLTDLGTPRHGLGVVTAAGRVYAIGGGPEPGLFVSEANEFLPLP